jgi:hypothetical protein
MTDITATSVVTLCAWHRKYFGHDHIVRVVEAQVPDPTKPSHGICKDCSRLLEQENIRNDSGSD